LPAGQPRTDVEARIAANKSKLAELDRAIASLEADLANAIKGLGPELTARANGGRRGIASVSCLNDVRQRPRCSN
jgi:hypothetical protein